MRRSWAVGSLVLGIALWGVAIMTFLVEIGDHDVSEGIGLLALLIGLFFLWEGGFALWRSRAVAHSRDRPR